MSQRNACVPDDVGGGEACTVLEALGRVSGKWSIGVLMETTRGPVRFTELERAITGVSRRMLTLTLRNLERDGLVVRTVHAEVPPRVEYALTATGRSLLPPALALAGWAIEHVPHIESSRAAYESRTG
jgi:DNA-binding HxlR family transcriptional regulator